MNGYNISVSGRAEMEIRLAGGADVAAVAAFRGLSDGSGEGVSDKLQRRLSQWMFEPGAGRTTWLALTQAVPVGMVSLTEYRRMPSVQRADSCWGYVGNLFVAAEFRRRGIARGLLATLVATADERGYVRLLVSPSIAAVPVFEHAGFADCGGPSGTLLMVRAAPET